MSRPDDWAEMRAWLTREIFAQEESRRRSSDRQGASRGIAVGRYPCIVYWTIERNEVWVVHVRHDAREPWRGLQSCRYSNWPAGRSPGTLRPLALQGSQSRRMRGPHFSGFKRAGGCRNVGFAADESREEPPCPSLLCPKPPRAPPANRVADAKPASPPAPTARPRPSPTLREKSRSPKF